MKNRHPRTKSSHQVFRTTVKHCLGFENILFHLVTGSLVKDPVSKTLEHLYNPLRVIQKVTSSLVYTSCVPSPVSQTLIASKNSSKTNCSNLFLQLIRPNPPARHLYKYFRDNIPLPMFYNNILSS